MLLQLENACVEKPQIPLELEPLLASLKYIHQVQEVVTIAVATERQPVSSGGRPTVVDGHLQEKICLLLKFGYSRSLAAAEVGISRSAITKAMKRDADFRLQVEDAERLALRAPLLTVLQAAQHNWRAAIWVMKHCKSQALVRKERLADLRADQRVSLEADRLQAERSKMAWKHHDETDRQRDLERGVFYATKDEEVKRLVAERKEAQYEQLHKERKAKKRAK